MKASVIVSLLFAVTSVHGHGRLMNPPARNAMWRFGFTTPVNYNDNEVFCGGFGVQFDKNGGKCGVCGDDISDSEPREHENGGKFGTGQIAKRYVMGQTIDVEVDLTTNHWGFFELKLCPVNNRKEVVTQECLDSNPLTLVDDPASSKYYIPKGSKKKAYLSYQVKLPEGITCQQCVIQWTYNTGNTWGTCANGTQGVGCGDQEMFRNCADVQIYSNAVGLPPTAIVNPNAIYFRDKSAPGGRRAFVNRYQVCEPTRLYSFLPAMKEWCQRSCLTYPPSNCPLDKCTCYDECVAIGEYRDLEGTDVWCQRQCLRFPSNCPKDKCSCFATPVDNDIIQELF